jgi:hypothetical protein
MEIDFCNTEPPLMPHFAYNQYRKKKTPSSKSLRINEPKITLSQEPYHRAITTKEK